MKNNKNNLSLYLVKEGQVYNANEDTEWDGDNSILVLAYDEEYALVTAAAYDRELIQEDNHMVPNLNKSVVCVFLNESDNN
jgi:hypothetical protein